MAQNKVLVVEDENIMARDVRNMLIGLGYEVAGVVPSGEEAVEKARETQPDLALLDVMLQGEMSGVEAADIIYSHFNSPVVYLTAYADETTLQRAKETEPFGYLLKPFEERELQTTIEIALYKYRMEMKLKNRERWLTTILQSVGDGVIATGEQGKIQFMNPFAEDLTGWAQEEATGKELSEVFQVLSEKTGKSLKIPAEKILKGEKYKISSEVLLLSKTGKKTFVLQHHERMDGTGYPEGLRGEDIFLEARILAVADVIEAMATHRPYRAALTIEAALDEITSGRGEKYDIQVVDACLRVFKNKKFAFD